MSFSIPMLTQFPVSTPAKETTVTLSSLSGALKVQIPDSDEIPANWGVYLILGADYESPDWAGPEEPTGVYDDACDDLIKVTGVELEVPEAELEKYKNSTIELRYKFSDESSLTPCSEPVVLRIED
ncbi:hypothetical protein BLL42_09265 [Pseudomonas frederiksbergensis]|uniref:Uncharacterized protein n=1 Tax=Pseudomonas frederiksbergensis TaxID=104087 RepID=A0A1J0EJ29_9PSED|nr:hypothetical protein [Pseudomonas frederiksbergensis]APC15915.1 hypothetical protein BLL42_09265 [Pseudomonas frederiksbergensis]